MQRVCLSLLLLATSNSFAAAQSVFLGETGLQGACFNIELTMHLKGSVTVQQAGQPVNFPRLADATHSYFERILDVKENTVERTARYYNRAEAVIADNGEKFKTSLKANHATLLAHRLKDQLVLYHMSESLTREETEVTSHFDTLAAPGLLPRREVKVGETWSVPRDVVQALVDLNAIEKSDVVGTLDKIDGDAAHLSFRGLVQGIDMAAPVTIMVKDSSAVFNIKLKRLVQVDWKVTDQRQQGPASPGLSADVAFQLKRTPTETPAQLSDVALVKAPAGPPPASLTNITYRNLRKGFEFQFSRDWAVVSQSEDGKLVLRLIDARGEFIAQCAVTPWQKVDPKNLMKLADFSKLVRESKGWQQKEGPPLDENDRIKTENGYTIFRVTAEGNTGAASPTATGSVAAVRSFYLIATPAGEQILFDFTMLPSQAAKLDGRDVTLVQSVQFLESGKVEATPASQQK